MKDFFVNVFKRLNALIIKLISVKGLVFFVATWLKLNDRIDSTTWMLTSGIIIGGRAIEKIKTMNNVMGK